MAISNNNLNNQRNSDKLYNIQPRMDLKIILFDPQQSFCFDHSGKFTTEKLFELPSI